MSVDKTPTGVVYTVTNGAAGQQYPLTFPYIKGSDVKAYYVQSGTQTGLTYGTHYTVVNQDFIASIVLPVGAKLAIYRQTDLTQEILWKDGQAVYTPDIMKADDKLTLIVQEISADMSRTVKLTREEEAAGGNPEGVVAAIYASRDAAAVSARDAFIAKNAAQLAIGVSGLSNVKSFGAQGDNDTDDTDAIRNAIVYALSTGSGIYFPAGRYKVSSTLNNLLSVRIFGEGIIVSGADEFYASNIPGHTNTIYVTVNGGGDGLSASTPITIQDAWQALQNVGYLRGLWVIQCAAGIYQTGMQFTNVIVEDRNGLVIQGVVPDRSQLQYVDAWPTQFIPYSTADYSNIMSFYSVTNIGVKNIWFKHDINITKGTCVAFAYGCQRCFIENCCVTNGTWCGVIFQNIQYGSISNCIVDSSDQTKCVYGVNAYNSFVNSNNGGLTRNAIKRWAVGFFAQGGRSYVHNDYNDFILCGTAIRAEYNAHIENNYNTFTDCTITQEHMFGAEGVVPSVSGIGTVRAAFGPLGARDDTGVACWPGVFVYSSGTRGRFSMFENTKNRGLFHRLLLNMGDSDLDNVTDSGLSGQAVIYNTTDSSLGITYVNPTAINKYYSTGSSKIAKEVFSATYANYSLYLGDVSSFVVNSTSIGSGVDNVHSCGTGTRRFSVVYAASGSINTSDEREKQQIQGLDDAVLDAWGDVQLRSFLFNDAVAQKGASARIHSGVIAQQVISSFTKHGLDATMYALLCYDKWEDEYEDVEVVDQEAIVNAESGDIEQERKTHVERKLIIQAGERYGIRYEEALCVEAAYQRRRADRLETRLADIENKLSAAGI